MKEPFQLIQPAQLRGGRQNGRLVDVRNHDEYQAVHVEGAVCVPLPRLLAEASAWDPAEDLVLICQSGQRARQGAWELCGAGFGHVSVVDGGTQAAVAAGLPAVRGRRVIPLQRQVMIGAGLVLLTGLALATLVSPWFILLDWFAATFLVIAGLTGFCPMAKVLAAMPWNRPAGSGQAGTMSSGAACAKGTCA